MISLEYSTELGAVNEIIGSIGEPPVNSLEGEPNADVVNARRLLYNANREVQSKGWTFNIEEGVELLPDVFSNMIMYDSDILNMRDSQTATPYVNIGGYVYDRINRVDRFDGPITVNIIRMRTLDEMPECFKRWIILKASAKFAQASFGDPDTVQLILADVEQARIDCNEYELDYGNYNALSGDLYITQALNRG